MWQDHPSFDDIIKGEFHSSNDDPGDNRYFQRKRQKEDEEMVKKGYFRKEDHEEDHDGDADCFMNGDYDTW